MAEWYYAENDDKKGPISDAQLKTLVQQGVIKRDTLVWKDGLKDWVVASKLKGLFLPLSSKSIPNLPVSKSAATRAELPTKAPVVAPTGGAQAADQDGKEISGVSSGRRITAFILCLFLGWLGVHRVYLKKSKALLMLISSLLTCTLVGNIWAIVDLFRIASGSFTTNEGQHLGQPVRWMKTVSTCWLVLAVLCSMTVVVGGYFAVLGGSLAGNTRIVKSAVLDMNKSLTIGEAFDKYSHWKERYGWTTFDAKNGVSVVEFSGTQKDEDGEYLFVFHFAMNKDGSFTYTGARNYPDPHSHDGPRMYYGKDERGMLIDNTANRSLANRDAEMLGRIYSDKILAGCF